MQRLGRVFFRRGPVSANCWLVVCFLSLSLSRYTHTLLGSATTDVFSSLRKLLTSEFRYLPGRDLDQANDKCRGAGGTGWCAKEH